MILFIAKNVGQVLYPEFNFLSDAGFHFVVESRESQFLGKIKHYVSSYNSHYTMSRLRGYLRTHTVAKR